MTFKKFLQKKNQGKSNKDVMMTLEKESAYNPSNNFGVLENQLAKNNRHQNAHIDQVTQALKKEYQKQLFTQRTDRLTVQSHREWSQSKGETKNMAINPANQQSLLPRLWEPKLQAPKHQRNK